MQRVLSIFMALCISLTFALDAHAKRFGGGKSFGSAPSHQTRQAPQQTQAAPNQAGRQTPAAASGASRWLGPLAGLAAGGLLASMFMGDGFEGIQFMDILIFGLIAFLLFRFLAARRRQQEDLPVVGPQPHQQDADGRLEEHVVQEDRVGVPAEGVQQRHRRHGRIEPAVPVLRRTAQFR